MDILFVDDEEVRNSPVQFGEHGAGDIKYRDVNRDGVISELDMVPIGYSKDPEIVYGFGASYGFKNFDISVFFQGLARESFWMFIVLDRIETNMLNYSQAAKNSLNRT